MKKFIAVIAALSFFAGVHAQDLQVRSINITSQAKLNGKDVTNSLSGATTALTFADSLILDFRKTKFQTLALTDSIVFKDTKNTLPGHEIDLRITGHASAVSTLAFPATWKFVGTKPTSIAATKTGLLVLRSYGTTQANIVAHYVVEP